MKYIRTKDGRILDLDRIKLYAESYSFNNESETHLSIEWDIIREEIDIIKQTDTIEELCDEIVEVIDGKAQVVYADISFNDLAIAKIRDKNNAIVYGAIWTKKGLIYVAKMNDKGDLELL